MEKELTSREIIIFDMAAADREEVISIIANAMKKDGRLIDRDGYIADVMKREAESATAVGFSVAVPHAKSVYVKEPSLAFARLKNKIKWDNFEKVDMIFQIGVPARDKGNVHLKILSAIFRKLAHDEFRKRLFNADNAEEVLSIIREV